MDYKKKYEEALARARQYYSDSVKQVVRDTVSYIFYSEFKGSEDERIRKALIDYFDNANKSDENPLIQYGIYTDKVITWLEKQGEQKPIDKIEPKFKVGDTVAIKHNPGTNKIYFTITDIIGGKYWYNDRIICDITEQDEWELYEPIKQKLTEWSEEDEDIINHLLAICAGAKRYRQFAGCSQDDIVKYQTWLKSLKQRIGE